MSQKRAAETARALIAPLPDSERRGRPRAKISQPVRVRPSTPHANHFDDVLVTINVCRNGIYFATERNNYRRGMRLFITFPYSESHGAINCEYIGEVVRLDARGNGLWGIAVHLLMTINLGTHPTYRR